MVDDFDTEFEKRYAQWQAGSRKEFVRAPRPGQGLNTPQDVALGIGGFLKQNALPLSLLGGTGAALDIALPEAGLPLTLARALLMGGENVALNKTLPESVGGSPQTSTATGFAAGALPEGLTLLGGRGATRFLENRLAKRGQGAVETVLGKLDPETLSVRERIMEPASRVPYPSPASGNELTRQTFEAQQPVNTTIQLARTKYGTPIGDAYRALKDADKPIDEAAARDIANDAQRVRDSLISPAPRAASVFAQIKRFVPQAPTEEGGKLAGFMAEDAAALKAMGKGEFMQPAPVTRESLKLQNFTDKQIEGILGSQGKPPTLDDLRELRQQVNTALRTAQGGDRYALGALQDRIDQELLPHLPDNMSELRRNYAGFINRWGYKAQAQFNRVNTTPQKVADWLFSDPAKAHDLMTEANPLERDQLRGQFLQHVYGSVDKTKSSAEQAAQVRKNLAPYMQDRATAELVMGPQAGQEMRDMVTWARYSKDWTEQYQKNPKFRDQMMRGWRDLVVSQGRDPDEAATQMVLQMTQQTPSLAQQVQGVPQLAQTIKSLPAPPPKAGSHNWFSGMAKMRHGVMAAGYGAAALGGAHMGMGMGYQIAALMTFVGSDAAASFAATSKLGITGPMLRAMQSKNGYLAGRALGRAFLNLGARQVQRGASEPLELQ